MMPKDGNGFHIGLLLAIAFVAIGIGNLLALVHLARYFSRRERGERRNPDDSGSKGA